MKKIVFLLGFLPNPRMYKRIALAQTFSNVHLICWDKGKEMLENPQGRNIDCSIIKENAGNDPIRRLLPLFRFRKSAMKVLKEESPDLIHVQGLDMLQIACEYKKRHKNVKIVYEVADLHRLLVDKQKGIVRKIAQKYLQWQDKVCGKKSDLLIVTSQMYYNKYFYRFISKDKEFYFPNVPDLSVFSNYRKKNNMDNFTIGFFGVIRYKEELKMLIDFVSTNPNISLIIAGYETNDNEIETMCRNVPNIRWIGRYDFKESASELYGQCDSVYAVYNSDMSNCRVALPNKLYEAVYCELPILVAANTHVAEIVEEWGVGLSVIHNSKESLCCAIAQLTDEEKYEQMVLECRRHKEEINLNLYNERLKTIIQALLNK